MDRKEIVLEVKTWFTTQNALLNIRFPQKADNSLKTLVTVSFSMAISCAVCYAGDKNCVVCLLCRLSFVKKAHNLPDASVTSVISEKYKNY